MPEKSPDSRDTNPNPVTEQVPHSGIHGNERPVYNFEGKDLQEALDRGDLHIEYDEAGKPKVIVPNSLADHIDPTQSKRTEAYEPLVAPVIAPETQSKWYTKTAAKVAGVVLALTGVAGGIMAATGGDNDSTEPRVEPSTSASPNPGEATAPTPSPETPDPTATGEVVASVEQYPTAAEAIYPLVAQIDAYQNYYGTTENLTSTPISDKQRAEHEAMLQAIFGPHYDSPEVSGFVTNLKESWPEVNGYKSLTQQAIEAGYDEELFTMTHKVTELVPIGGNQVQFILTNDANFENNEIEENMDPAYAASIETPLKVTATLEQVDGAWYIANWDTTQV